MNKVELEARLEEIAREFQEQIRMLQAHYEGRAAEVRRMLEQENASEDKGNGG